jgi:ketopantoate reductase
MLSCLYAHHLFQAGKDVTLLERCKQFDFIKEHGVAIVNKDKYQYEERIEKACLNSIP